MPYVLGQRRLAQLKGLHLALVAVVKRAIATSTQNLITIDGLRSLDRQTKLVAIVASKTLSAMHILAAGRFE